MKQWIKVVVMVSISAFFVGCASVADLQNSKMAGYRADIEREYAMSDAAREQYYQDALWFQPSLWKAESTQDALISGAGQRDQNSRDHNLRSQDLRDHDLRSQDFYSCVQAADAIESGISEQIGGIDPIQIIHARASVELCMVSKEYRAIDPRQTLICESPKSDVLPICVFLQEMVLNYRSWG